MQNVRNTTLNVSYVAQHECDICLVFADNHVEFTEYAVFTDQVHDLVHNDHNDHCSMSRGGFGPVPSSLLRSGESQLHRWRLRLQRGLLCSGVFLST